MNWVDASRRIYMSRNEQSMAIVYVFFVQYVMCCSYWITNGKIDLTEAKNTLRDIDADGSDFRGESILRDVMNAVFCINSYNEKTLIMQNRLLIIQ